MNFRTWLEMEAGLNSSFPELMVNRGSNTPASDAVHRTGLQPQVDSEEIHTDEKENEDKIQAIDRIIQQADNEMPQNGQSGDNRVNNFKNLWNKLKITWEQIKLNKKASGEVATNGLGSTKGDEKMIQLMQQNPNLNP